MELKELKKQYSDLEKEMKGLDKRTAAYKSKAKELAYISAEVFRLKLEAQDKAEPAEVKKIILGTKEPNQDLTTKEPTVITFKDNVKPLRKKVELPEYSWGVWIAMFKELKDYGEKMFEQVRQREPNNITRAKKINDFCKKQMGYAVREIFRGW